MLAWGGMAALVRENIMSRTKSSRLMQAFQIPHASVDGNINSLNPLTKRHRVTQSLCEEETNSFSWSLMLGTWDSITEASLLLAPGPIGINVKST